MTSLSCGVEALLQAAQYLQLLEEQESSQQQQQPPQLYRPIVLENNSPISTGMYILKILSFFFLFLSTINSHTPFLFSH